MRLWLCANGLQGIVIATQASDFQVLHATPHLNSLFVESFSVLDPYVVTLHKDLKGWGIQQIRDLCEG